MEQSAFAMMDILEFKMFKETVYAKNVIPCVVSVIQLNEMIAQNVSLDNQL